MIILLIGLCLPAKSQLLLMDTQERIEVAGTITATNLKVDRYEVGDVTGHYVAIIKSEGINDAPDSNDFMDGAQVVNLIMSDNTNGSGPFNGYLKFSKNGASVCLEWTGYMRTKPGEKNRLCFTGSFSFSNGTGMYENIYGVGIFEGEFISENQYVAEWKGRYSLNREAVLQDLPILVH